MLGLDRAREEERGGQNAPGLGVRNKGGGGVIYQDG